MSWHRPVALTAVVVAAGAAVVALVGCGEGTTGDRTTATTTGEGPVGDVSLSVAVHAAGRHLRLDYTLTNTGTAPAAVVDTESVNESVERLPEGVLRARFLRSEGEPAAGGGSPLPSLLGRTVAAGGDLRGSVVVTGGWTPPPTAVQLCIEVAPQPWRDRGDGVAEIAYRMPGTAPALVCSPQLPPPTPPSG